ncbi:MAG TPA: SDR family NAD(P)-dependent oxidoreductase [Candidatus Dormibacteraeota bacterium]|nr:SDR family NAD(P)-dependent oxidoreductase [Candidatus Dormibacteraeota bacterium]
MNDERYILITGGAGFIGTNLAHRLLNDGKRVLIFDNLSRAGVENNLRWLLETHGERVEFQRGDVRDPKSLARAVAKCSHVFHFAAQVAVTTSLDNPIEDFEINARGTLNLLEAIRAQTNPPSIVLTSTNKVYGDLADVTLQAVNGRYEPVEEKLRAHGFGEARPLAFHSPYGCSKGAACQYVLDYARTFGLRTAVFRMSCIYGPHQFGNEDQGWVAHFLIKAMQGRPITIYGDGRQVRDILFVDDLVNAFLLAHKHIGEISGQAFNIGGGPGNTISLLELLDLIAELRGEAVPADFSAWRAADQKYYVSDTRKFSGQTGWSSTVNVRDGVTRLYQWLEEFGMAVDNPTSRESFEREAVLG